MTGVGMNMEGMDPKTALNQFCQRFCQRAVSKEDIVYTTTKYGMQHQAIVKLNCTQGQEFAGELCAKPKDAEKSAAQQALKAYALTIANLPPPASKDKKQKPAGLRLMSSIEGKRKGEDGELVAPETEVENPAYTPKVKLNAVCMKLAHRALQKGETVYETRPCTGGHQATVKLSCLPGEWAGRIWAGQVCATKQKADQSAAEIALAQIMADADLSAILNKPSAPKNDGKGKGRGKGKGKNFGIGKGYGQGFYGYPKGKWGLWPGMDMRNWVMVGGMGGNWSGGKGRGKAPSGPNLARERVTETPVSGDVLEWRGKFGWLKPHSPLDHPAAKKRDGKIYANVQDLSGGLTSLASGSTAQFHVYADSSGLGAEEVTPL